MLCRRPLDPAAEIADHPGMALVRELEWEACLLEPRPDPEVVKKLKQTHHRVSPGYAFFTDCPWAPEVNHRLNAAMFTRVFVDHDLADLAGLVVSQDNSCRFCFAAQNVLLRGLGMPKARIAQLEQDFRTADFSPHERAGLEFARRVSRSNPLPGEPELQMLRDAGFEELEIKELALVVALMILFNRSSTLAALKPQSWEALPERWYARVMFPLIRPYLRRIRHDGQLQPLTEAQKQGPFSQVVCALDGLPGAHELRAALDAMWDSKILSRRAKAYVFAVVARALGCDLSDREAVRLLLAEGEPESQISEVLAHLGSPKLDDVERVIVPFARETVWYEAAPLQRRARQVRDALSNAQFIEFIMVAGLANAVCRLGIVVDKT